jgi:hypothetical protein
MRFRNQASGSGCQGIPALRAANYCHLTPVIRYLKWSKAK